jgi:hypothetical protein
MPQALESSVIDREKAGTRILQGTGDLEQVEMNSEEQGAFHDL